MSGRTLNVIIAVCVVATTVQYFRFTRKFDADARDLDTALENLKSRINGEEPS